MSTRVYVDRIEGDRVILVLGPDGRETVSVPARLLPDGVREGAALDLTLVVVPQDAARQEIESLMDDLFSEPSG